MGHLAGVVRGLREDVALTQEELAERSGLSVRTISDIERGLRKRLYRDTAERLGLALRLADDRLADFVEQARGRTSTVQRDLDSEFRRRFVAWHVDRVTSLAAHVGNEEAWFAVLDADEANLAVALRWADESADAEALLRLGAALFRYWQARGELALGRGWLHRGLATADASDELRGPALWGLAWLAYQQGDYPAVSTCSQELTLLADGFADPTSARTSATVRGIDALGRGLISEAVDEFRTAAALARDLDQPWLLSTSLLNLGIGLIASGDLADARAVIAEALRGYDDVGDERFRARSLGYLGLAALVDRDAERGEALYAQSLSVFEALGEPKGIAEGLSGLATAAAIRGLPERAAELGGAAERLRESYGGCALPVERRLEQAELTAARGRTEDRSWDDSWIRGRALRVDEAIDRALALPQATERPTDN